jgi:hypothetical protein
MASERRQLPRSNVKRNIALTAAKARNTELVDAGMGYLSTGTNSTTAKLEYIEPLYRVGSILVASCKSADMTAVVTKNKSIALLKRGNKRFIKVFVEAAEDEEFPLTDFAYYHLDATGNLPDMTTEDEIKAVAANLIAGEAARVAAGGAPMSNPGIGVIVSRNTRALIDSSAQRFTADAYADAERALDALNEKADEALLFVYNEVETHFSNLTNSATRVEGKKWGIKYVKAGSPKVVSGKVSDVDSGDGIAGADVYFDNGNNSDESGVDFAYTLNTTLMDVQKLIATCPGYFDWSEDVTLIEGENLVKDIKMTKKP